MRVKHLKLSFKIDLSFQTLFIILSFKYLNICRNQSQSCLLCWYKNESLERITEFHFPSDQTQEFKSSPSTPAQPRHTICCYNDNPHHSLLTPGPTKTFQQPFPDTLLSNFYTLVCQSKIFCLVQVPFLSFLQVNPLVHT